MRKAFLFFLCLILLAGMIPTVSAEPETSADITANTQFSGTGYGSFDFLADKNIDSYKTSSGNASITLSNPQGIAGLYILFDLEYGSYTITDADSGKQLSAGTHGILHEYVDLATAFGYIPTSVTLDFTNGSVRLSEIYVFSGSNVPDFVQKWNPPLHHFLDLFRRPFHKSFTGFETEFALVQHLFQQRTRLMTILQSRKHIRMDIPCQLC